MKTINEMKTSIFNTRIIRKGSQVLYRGSWGRDGQRIAEVIAIEQTQGPNEKYGDEVDAVTLDDHYVLTLNNGHLLPTKLMALSNPLKTSELQNKFE